MADQKEKDTAEAPVDGASTSSAENESARRADETAESDNAETAQKKPEMPRALVKFANGGLWFFAFLFAMNLFFALHLHRKPGIKIIAATGLVVMLAARLRGKPQLRMSLVLALTPAFLGLTAFEIFMVKRRPRSGTAAALRGKPFDSRGLFEVIRDVRKQIPNAQSYAIPRALLTHNVAAPPWADEAIAHTVRPDWGLMVDGVQTLPFAGVSNRHTVFCNEGGYWAQYESDEYGFNNPKGIWNTGPIDLAILGDSYSQGACVHPQNITAAHIRKKFPKTLTFGMCANGPLMEYANLRENVIDLKPKVVLWVYYSNDLSDMNVETQSTTLMKYVEDDNFRQHLKERQAAIDNALDTYLNEHAARVPMWPTGLDSVGLTRQSTPLFLQDIVMREQRSSVASVVRLDWFTNAITSRFLEKDFFKEDIQWDLFRKVLSKAKTTVDTWGGQTYFVYLPDVFFLKPGMEQPLRKGVLEAANNADMRVIDIHEVFKAMPNPESYRPHYEAHFTEEGFELVAKVILERLEKDGLVPAAAPTP
ncbi:MAG: hypothetical protein IPK82_05830 [Polyangiaceae bacterium]|nr:hypothetical protein [Polyangiaceae bacterium]